MPFSTILKEENFNVASGESQSYYDDIFCPNMNTGNLANFKELKNKNYKGTNNSDLKIMNNSPINYNSCEDECTKRNECTGFVKNKDNKCIFYESYPKPNDIIVDDQTNLFLKIKNVNYNYQNLNSNQKERIKKYCQGMSFQHFFEKKNKKKYDNLNQCIKNL
jgi:hypothetical protein